MDRVGSSGARLEEDFGNPNLKQWGWGPKVVIPSPNTGGQRKGAKLISLKPTQIHPMPRKGPNFKLGGPSMDPSLVVGE